MDIIRPIGQPSNYEGLRIAEIHPQSSYRRRPEAENQPTTAPRSNPASGANGTSVVTLTRIPSVTPTVAPIRANQIGLRSLLALSGISGRSL